MSQFQSALTADVDAFAKAAENGARSVGLSTFINVAIDWLKGLARDKVDTEEERDAIVAAVMAVADAFVASRFPPFVWRLVRPNVERILDDAIDNLPALLG